MSRNTSQTTAILDAVVTRLTGKLGRELVVELFPENPQHYRLNHARGAVLVAFGTSRFSRGEATDTVFQDRDLTIPLTLIFRQLNGPEGVVAYLDRIRAVLTGFVPPHCSLALAPLEESFLGQRSGLWQYAQKYLTRATQVQLADPHSDPLLTHATFEEAE